MAVVCVNIEMIRKEHDGAMRKNFTLPVVRIKFLGFSDFYFSYICTRLCGVLSTFLSVLQQRLHSGSSLFTEKKHRIFYDVILPYASL